MTKQRYFFLVLILGTLTALSPFSIDMYLPAFQDIAKSLNTTTAKVDLSLSSYFIGLAVGQLIYGPLMDRFGRKRPLYFGLGLYIIASVGCFLSASVQMLIVIRLLQAIGGCAASVAAVAMVRDLFPVKDSAKVFALLFLVLGASPLIAPTAGGYLADAFGWQSVFIMLLAIAILIFIAVVFTLPESYKADKSYSLKPGPIIQNFLIVIREPQFYTYAIAGSMAFCGLFAYVAGSPLIFMDIFDLSKKEYGWVFAGLSVGFIGSSQLNSLLIKRFKSEQVINAALIGQVVISIIFIIGSVNGWFGLAGTIVMIFLVLCCIGLINPNTSALSMAPFPKNAGVASSLLGTMQLGLGAAASFGVSVFHSKSAMPMVAIMAVSSAIGLVVLLIGRRNIVHKVEVDASAAVGASH
ncbi:MAG TPA: multidrug effflux MFS transporter [Mucilaginibacter sp.]|nr:multidrug effflux MFS transporter [Mucilaginibacter sp.]